MLPVAARSLWPLVTVPVAARQLASFVRPRAAPDAGVTHVEVCCIDPRTVLEHEKWKAEGSLAAHKEEEIYTSVTVPVSLLPLLSQGENELGDMDDPMNNWYFGKRAEIFQYQLVGTHLTKSGWSSIIERAQLESIYQGATVGLPTWEEFVRLMKSGTKLPTPRLPFLFAGLMVETAEAAVYILHENSGVTGVLISSEAMGS